MVRTRVLVLVMGLAWCAPAAAQEAGTDFCGLLDMGNGPASAKDDLSPPAILSLLVSKAGLKADDFHLIAWSLAPVKGNAYAQYCAKQRWNSIFYDPAFVPTATAASDDDAWFARFVFAHEVGHHIKNHFLGPPKLRPDKEAEADEWAGWAMARIGAPIDRILAAIDRLQQADFATDKYYSRCHRRMDALKGFNAASRDEGKPTYEACLECYAASAPGLYLTRDVRARTPFTADLVRACGAARAGTDRPLTYGKDLAGGCVSADTRGSTLVTWDNVTLCK